MPRGVLRISGLSMVLGVLSCSLLVETSEISEGCGDGMKFCDDKCVSIDEPFWGCSPTQCTPCVDADHIVNECVDGDCVFVACQFGWGCAGCEKALLTDRMNCGRCGNPCIGDTNCSNGVCVGPYDAGSGAGGEGGNPG